ncbi:sporulation protein YunB [Niallia taxi]|uniref:sporulation protein YunB n=1 Tax=Niallia taxi TaxID=2499688 RepID=UPI003F6397DF
MRKFYFRQRMPKKKPLTFQQVLLITAVFFILSTLLSFWIINNGLKPTLSYYAQSQTKKLATLVINDALQDETEEEDNNLMIDGNNFVFNTAQVVKKQQEITSLVQENITRMEKGEIPAGAELSDIELDKNLTAQGKGIVYNVPIGQATNNALLGNLGPDVPIKFNVVGSVKSDLKTEMENVGINYVVVKAFVEIKVDIQIIIPFATKLTTVKQDILIAMAGFEGDVPEFYNGSGSSSVPALQLPTDNK